LYFFCVLFGFAVFPFLKALLGQTPTETADLLLFATFLSNFNNIVNGQPDAGILALLWSVSVEEQFYIFWPLLFILFKKKRVWLFILIILVSILFRFIYFKNFTVIYHHTLSYAGDMALGGFAGWLMFNYPDLKSYFINLSKKAIIGFYFISFIILGLKPYLVSNLYFIGLREILFSFVFTFIILEQNFSKNSFYKIGNSHFVSYWGKYTYGLYCLHFIIILVITNLFKYLGLGESIWHVLLIIPLISFSATLFVSWISFNYFEVYFLKLKDKFAFSFVTDIKHKERKQLQLTDEVFNNQYKN
ncbi:MAG: acyltransferase family protein, partial [Adhaeribacter sp.]